MLIALLLLTQFCLSVPFAMTLSNEAIIAIVSLIIQLVAPIISHYYRAGNLNG